MMKGMVVLEGNKKRRVEVDRNSVGRIGLTQISFR